VRRLVAVVLVQALAVSTSMASSLHVHEYIGHDHPDHHHGPAAHEHNHPATVEGDHHHARAGDEDQPAWQDDPCEPGRHAVAVRMGCACIPQAHVDLAELPGPTLAVQGTPNRSAVPITDVRVHGPPLDARIRARAPPLIPQA